MEIKPYVRAHARRGEIHMEDQSGAFLTRWVLTFSLACTNYSPNRPCIRDRGGDGDTVVGWAVLSRWTQRSCSHHQASLLVSSGVAGREQLLRQPALSVR